MLSDGLFLFRFVSPIIGRATKDDYDDSKRSPAVVSGDCVYTYLISLDMDIDEYERKSSEARPSVREDTDDFERIARCLKPEDGH